MLIRPPHGIVVDDAAADPLEIQPFECEVQRGIGEREAQRVDQEVELRVTLSYFPEPNTFRRRVSHGLDLKWDMQGPTETWSKFRERVNKLARGDVKKKTTSKSFDWELGITRRTRGTLQSDRWSGPASYLAGEKHIAVVPVLGWWERRPALRELAMPFSLIVTVRAAGIDIYQPIRAAVENVIEITA
jgi:hypothetical protein